MLIRFLFILCIFSGVFFQTNTFAAAQQIYPFTSLEDQKRFDQMIHQTRCLVCKNQTIAESNASLAKDLRQKIYEQIKAGASDQAIQNYLTQRYGEFILFQPAFNTVTYILWLTPLILFVLALFLLFYILYQRQQR